MLINNHMCHNKRFVVLKLNNKKYNYFFKTCFIYIQLNGQKLPTSARTDAGPDARLLVHLVKPSRKGFISILSKTHFRY